jgi:hypothetical protein
MFSRATKIKIAIFETLTFFPLIYSAVTEFPFLSTSIIVADIIYESLCADPDCDSKGPAPSNYKKDC